MENESPLLYDTVKKSIVEFRNHVPDDEKVTVISLGGNKVIVQSISPDNPRFIALKDRFPHE